MIRTLVLFALFVGFTLSVYGQSDGVDWIKLNSDTYAMSYPSDWFLDESGVNGALIQIYSNLTGAGDVFRDNVNYIKQDLTGEGITFEDYMDISKSDIYALFTNGKVTSIEEGSHGDFKTFHMTYEGMHGVFDLKFECIVHMKDDVYHLLTYTAERKQYKTFKETAMSILNSFKLK